MDLKEFLMTMVAFHDTANNMMDEPPQANDLFSSDDLNLQSNQFNQSSVVPGSLASYDSTGQRTEHVSIPHQRVGDDEERVSDPENDEHIRFYFNMFDFDNTGKIELDEMKIVIRCIFADLINQENRPTSSILTHQLSRHSSSHSIHSSPLRSPYYDLTSVPTLADIELMFENILQHSNINSKKSINYEEFKVFYNNLFINSSTIIHRS